MTQRRPVERYVNVNGVRTRYYEAGRGEPLVLIHGGEPGGSAGADIWSDLNFAQLAEAFHVVAPDRVSQGYTDNPAEPSGYRISAISEHLGSFLDVIGLSGVTLVGQSRGAFLSAYLAMQHPELVNRIVLINSASVSPRHTADIPLYRDLVKGTVASVWSDAAALSVDKSHITDEWVARVQRLRSQPKISEARRTFTSVAQSYYSELDSLKPKLLDWLKGPMFSGPIMIFWGVGDPLTSLSDASALFELCSNGRRITRMYLLSDCGHFAFREHPSEFADSIMRFTRATPSR